MATRAALVRMREVPAPPSRSAGTSAAKRAGDLDLVQTQSVREVRRAQILAAARTLVARDGLEALTFGALEAVLGFSRGVMTYHFADKEELTLALLMSAVAEIDADTSVRLGRTSTLEEKVRAVLASKARGFLTRKEASRVLLSFWGRAGNDARARAVHNELFARYRSESATLARAARKERPSIAINPDAFGALLVGAIIGLAVQAILQPDAFELDAAIEEASRMFAARLRGA